MVKKNIKQVTGEVVFGRRFRKFPRIQKKGFECQLADEKSVFKGSVEDLSAQGFSMKKVPAAFCNDTKLYRAIFSEGDNYFKITVIPRWFRLDPDGSGYHVGYKIMDNDWKWVHFSMEVLPSYTEK